MDCTKITDISILLEIKLLSYKEWSNNHNIVWYVLFNSEKYKNLSSDFNSEKVY